MTSHEQYGKDKVIFITEEEERKNHKIINERIKESQKAEDKTEALNDDGTIDWDCPCLGGAAYGPCGPEFRESFSCWLFNIAPHGGVDDDGGELNEGLKDGFRKCEDKFLIYDACKRELEREDDTDTGLNDREENSGADTGLNSGDREENNQKDDHSQVDS